MSRSRPLPILLLLLVSALSAGATAAFAANGFDFDSETPAATDAESAERIHLVDLDVDGDLDAFVAAGLLGEGFTYYENLGNGSWAAGAELLPTDGAEWQETTEVVSGDLDLDGDLDLVTSGDTDLVNDLYWWENTGGSPATWTSRRIAGSVSAEFETVRLRDLDGDADPDVLVIVAGELYAYQNEILDGTVTNWFGDSFGPVPDARRIEMADLDHDGDVDLVLPDDLGDRLVWWEDTLDEGPPWTERVIDGSFEGARGVAVADFDGDGDLDVAGAGNVADLVAWWANDGAGGGWVETPVAVGVEGPRDVRAVDVDRDGDVDLVGSSAIENRIVWWENVDGAGATWQENSLPGMPSFPEQVAVADLDGDGRQDVLGAAWGDDTLALWSGSAPDRTPWGWTRHEIASSIDSVHDVVMEDVDRDGDLDLLGAGSFGTRGVRWWENLGGGSWGAAQTLDAGLLANFWIAAGDLDGDGDPDFALAESLGDAVKWRENRLNEGMSWASHTVGTHGDPSSVVVVDVTGDGALDIVVSTSGAGGGLTAWTNDAGDGSTWTEIDIDFAETSMAHVVGDRDGDGDPDLTGISLGTFNRLSVWENPVRGPGSTWTEQSLITYDVDDPRDATWADLDGDGRDDAVAVGADGLVLAWLSNGGAVAPHQIDDASLGATAVAAADFDGDGDDDLAVASDTEGTVTWWRNDGAGTSWTSLPIATGLSAPAVLVAADVDRDGVPDLVVSDPGSEELFWIRTEPIPAGLLFFDGFESGTTSAWGG